VRLTHIDTQQASLLADVAQYKERRGRRPQMTAGGTMWSPLPAVAPATRNDRAGPAMNIVSGTTTLYAHRGEPIDVVKSPFIYNPWFRTRRIDAAVIPMGLRAPDFPAAIATFRAITNVEDGDPLPVDVTRLSPRAFVGEVVMKSAMTPLLKIAASRSCRYQPGLDRLYEQIPLYVELFGHGRPSPDELRAIA
jgi:shikimate 5-dehydrogenase